ncbi:ABC-2 type transport system ATP-binding protein [Caldalkalibacillus uzonensis]|uniref:ABC-2 type transport system ATP-binding protein n=1 Tax=Caldalkalibacillus uzonensis TaxID=353224 RepID=A0ABU0CSJ4_9BACI|nr:ABC transporter ATP-binding protein [Caldalkalibacillus uzonensis]MDQ0338839.1 ABC-2 type transport system ATP-binding protein [Caldalkalibacillus uzonensis]
MITFQNVSFCYGKEEVLKNLSFHIGANEIAGIVGPDGAGKSTLLKLLVGLLKPNKGRIQYAESCSTGFVAEHFGLYEDMSIEENLLFYGQLYGLSREEAKQRSEQLLAWTKLSPFKDRLAGHLSGGMKRKLAISSALLHRPSCLILDEPTHGVDPVSRQEIWQLIKEVKSEGASVIVSTQYLDEVSRCDEVLFLHQGELLKKTSPRVLIDEFPYKVYRIPDLRHMSLRELPKLKDIPYVADAFPRGVDWVFLVSREEAVGALRDWIKEKGLMRQVEPIQPTFEDVFIHLMGKGGPAHDRT